MERFIDARLAGLVAVARPTRTTLQPWQDYWANHRVGAAVLLRIALITGLATLTDSASKFRAFAIAWLRPAPEKVLVAVRVKNAGPEATEIDPLCEFYLTEDTGAVIHEYPRGRVRLRSVSPASLWGDFGLGG